jgi:RimJ/RimL family protein N-acetyltransferase
MQTPRLLLRLPSEAEIDDLAHVVAKQIMEREFVASEFMGAWTRLRPGGAFERNFIQYHWSMRGQWRPDFWRLELGVYLPDTDVPVGCMGVGAKDFARDRCVSTGSWLLPQWRGLGLGKHMRTAALVLAFDELMALTARSGAHPRNAPSLGVSRALGYEEDGRGYLIVDGRRVETQRLLLQREHFLPACAVEIGGLDRCRQMFTSD